MKIYTLRSSFIGTGAVKLTKLSNSELKKPRSLSDRRFSLINLIRKIYLKLRKKLIFMISKNKILITGIAGFIGFSVAKKLLKKKYTNYRN